MKALPFHLLRVVMKLSANLSLMYAELPLPLAMQNAAKAGFQAVEILFPYNDAPEQLARWLHTHNLQLALLNTPPGCGNEKGLAAVPGRQADFRIGLQQAMNVCAATGCRTVHVMAGFVLPGSEQAAHNTLMENLQWASDQARKAGCVLTLEPLNRADMPGYMYWHPDQVLAILRTIDSDHVKLQFDFYHTQKEGLSIEETLQACAGHIHHVQFAGVNGRHEPDLQDPDVRAGLLALKAQGYGGWVGCEYRPASTVQAGLGWRQAYCRLLAG